MVGFVIIFYKDIQFAGSVTSNLGSFVFLLQLKVTKLCSFARYRNLQNL